MTKYTGTLINDLFESSTRIADAVPLIPSCAYETRESSRGACDGGEECRRRGTVYHLADEQYYCLDHYLDRQDEIVGVWTFDHEDYDLATDMIGGSMGRPAIRQEYKPKHDNKWAPKDYAEPENTSLFDYSINWGPVIGALLLVGSALLLALGIAKLIR
jgi:hypothetical protein